jgi:hypothetical protein
MAQRWQLSGSRADLNVWPDSDHRFTNMATPLGDVALARTTTGSHRRWTTWRAHRLLSQPANRSTEQFETAAPKALNDARSLRNVGEAEPRPGKRRFRLFRRYFKSIQLA